MADFKIEKGVPLAKTWMLSEQAKTLIDQLEVGESFSFPMEHYLPIKRLIERRSYRKQWTRKFALRRVGYDKARIWRKA